MIYYKGINYCGNFTEITQQINIIEVNSMVYTQTDALNVNQPIVNFTVKLRRTSTVNIKVLDEADVSVASANVSVAGISDITDATGNVVLLLVPNGNQMVTTTL